MWWTIHLHILFETHVVLTKANMCWNNFINSYQVYFCVLVAHRSVCWMCRQSCLLCSLLCICSVTVGISKNMHWNKKPSCPNLSPRASIWWYFVTAQNTDFNWRMGCFERDIIQKKDEQLCQMGVHGLICGQILAKFQCVFVSIRTFVKKKGHYGRTEAQKCNWKKSTSETSWYNFIQLKYL